MSHTSLPSLIWCVADLLRGDYKRHAEDAWIDEDKTRTAYEGSFNWHSRGGLEDLHRTIGGISA